MSRRLPDLPPVDAPTRPGRLGWVTAIVCCVLPLVAGPLRAQTPPSSAARLRIAGSDLLVGPVEQRLKEHASEYDVNLTLSFAGSRLAQDRLGANLIDLAVLVDYPGATALPEGWTTAPIGYLTTVVAAPAGLNVDHISYTDLAKVFAANSAQANLRWGELGARGEWLGIPVRPMVTSPAGGMAEPIFRRILLQDGELKPEIPRYHANADTLRAAQLEEGALALLTHLPAEVSNLKALLVHPTVERVAFGPSPENLHAGDYSIRLPLRLAFERKRTTELLPLLRLWHSEEMAAALTATGVIPLPASTRNQQVFDLEVME